MWATGYEEQDNTKCSVTSLSYEENDIVGPDGEVC